MRRARFDAHDHCDRPGWATWGLRQNIIQRICPHWATAPIPQNDYCPQAYTHCVVCRTGIHWFNDGTHRYGSLSRYFANLGRRVNPRHQNGSLSLWFMTRRRWELETFTRDKLDEFDLPDALVDTEVIEEGRWTLTKTGVAEIEVWIPSRHLSDLP